jgi:hypothetical protein
MSMCGEKLGVERSCTRPNGHTGIHSHDVRIALLTRQRDAAVTLLRDWTALVDANPIAMSAPPPNPTSVYARARALLAEVEREGK